jgi:glutamate 5-kinase
MDLQPMTHDEQPLDRKTAVLNAKRVIVKIGSAVLRGPDGLDPERIAHLAMQIATLKGQGKEVIVVSSGAILAGTGRLGLAQKPSSIPEKQAAASVGQSVLVRAWDDSLSVYGLSAGQVLLTADDLAHRHRYLNARHTLRTLLDWGCIPVINENDTVRIDEIKFGDNDQLAALIAVLIGADLAVFLSDVEALYDGDPKSDLEARPINSVKEVDADILALAGTANQDGTGGMASKLIAARRLNLAGIPMILAPGRIEAALLKAMNGDEIGTFFAPASEHIGAMKHWLAHLPKAQGEIVIDDGAVNALKNKGTSLLPVGILSVSGSFGIGAAVYCKDKNGNIIGVGLVNYDDAEIKKIMGCKTNEIEARLGYHHSDEVIHRDHFALVDEIGTSQAINGKSASALR